MVLMKRVNWNNPQLEIYIRGASKAKLIFNHELRILEVPKSSSESAGMENEYEMLIRLWDLKQPKLRSYNLGTAMKHSNEAQRR